MINKLIFSTLILMTFSFAKPCIAQPVTCDCEADLIFLDSKIRKTTSYKRSFKTYDSTFLEVSPKAKLATSIYECFVLLNTLTLSINDNHSRVYGLDKGAVEDVRKDSLKFLEFKKSHLYNAYPKLNIDLDSLKKVLVVIDPSEIEGIYKKEGYMTIGVFKLTNEDIYQAIVIDSEKDVWSKGEVVYTLVPFGNNYLLNVGGNLSTKRLITYTERIENGFFLKMDFKKDLTKTNYAIELPSAETHFRDEITSDITYIRIGSFSGFNPTLSQAEAFYKTLEGSLTKRNLILDLRNNGGGGPRNSDLLFKILKKYLKNNSIHVITNHNTASNAEQFTYKLSQFKNCQVFGQRTNGTLTYELEGHNFELPSGNFTIALTSKTHLDYVHLESIGIKPQVQFNLESDWINQMVNHIVEKN